MSAARDFGFNCWGSGRGFCLFCFRSGNSDGSGRPTVASREHAHRPARAADGVAPLMRSVLRTEPLAGSSAARAVPRGAQPLLADLPSRLSSAETALAVERSGDGPATRLMQLA